MAARQCPNKNLLEYKKLEKAVGETQAFRAYVANNYEIPEEFADPSYTEEKIKNYVDNIVNEANRGIDDPYGGTTVPPYITAKQNSVLDQVNIRHDLTTLNPKGTKYEYQGVP